MKSSKKKILTRKMKKRQKKIHTRKKRTYIGGLRDSDPVATTQVMSPTESNPKTDAKPRPNFSKKFIDKVLVIIKGLILESTDELGHILGVDVLDPKEVNAKLDDLTKILADEKINAKVHTIVTKLSVLIAIAFDAALPHLEPMILKINDLYEKNASELGVSTITVLKNIGEAIPVYGAIVAIINSLSTISVTAANTASASANAQDAFNDMLNASSIDIKELLKSPSYKADFDKLLNKHSTIPIKPAQD